MNITYTWYVPDTLTITDPTQQGPLTGTRLGVDDVVVAVPWALKGEAEDGTAKVLNSVTPLGDASPESPTFKPFDQVTKADLENWLFAAPDGIGSLHKSDQEGQLRKQLEDRLAPAAPKSLSLS